MIESERLYMRKLTKDDLDTLHAILGNPEVMYAWEHGFSRKETREWLARNMHRYEKDGCGFLLAIDKKSDRVAGVIGLINSDINGTRDWEIGYILDKWAWGKGYAQEGAGACAAYAFSQWDIPRVVIQMRTNNPASAKTAEAVGAELQGEYVRHYCGKDMPHYIYVVSPDCLKFRTCHQ